MVHPEISPEKRKGPIRKLRIGVDLDNTVWNLFPPTMKFLNSRLGLHLTEENADEFGFVPKILRQQGLGKQEIQFLFQEMYGPTDKYRLYRDSLPMPGAIEVLNGLYRTGHEINVLTGRPPGMEKIIEEQFREVGINWIKGNWANGGNILIRDEYYFRTIASRMFGGREFKLRAIVGGFTDGIYRRFEGVDLHLDDMGELFDGSDGSLDIRIRQRVFALDQLHNHGLVPQENSVKNWWMFYKMVRCLARGEEFDLASVAQC